MNRAKKQVFYQDEAINDNRAAQANGANQGEEEVDSEAAQLNALRQACQLIYDRLLEVHVLNDQQVRAMSMKLIRPLGLEMDSLIPFLNKFTIVANDKYYRLDLDTPEETSARNLIIELLMRAERN